MECSLKGEAGSGGQASCGRGPRLPVEQDGQNVKGWLSPHLPQGSPPRDPPAWPALY